MMARATRMYPRCRRLSQKNRIVDAFTRRSRGENEIEKEGKDPTINIMWKLERKRGWRNDDDDDDDDRVTMMFHGMDAVAPAIPFPLQKIHNTNGPRVRHCQGKDVQCEGRPRRDRLWFPHANGEDKSAHLPPLSLPWRPG